MPFQQFGLSPSLLRNIKACGYTAPTPIQTQAIPVVREGRDVVAIAQTGTGKTAAFLLPLIERLLADRRKGASVVILTPTRELAQQIQTVLRSLTNQTPMRSALVIGGMAIPPQVRALRDGVDFVIATPGRLLALLREGMITLPHVRTVVLDEADQMFDFGFFPDVKSILKKLPMDRQTLLFSATMPPDVAALGRTILKNPVAVSVGVQGTAVDSVTQSVYPVPRSRKTALLQHLLKKFEKPSVLVFTRTKRTAKKLARALYQGGGKVAELHSDCSPGQRSRAMAGFRDKHYSILVATNIAARGLDVRHITHVINYDAPLAPEEYVHRIGRTGRAGDEGEALVFVAPDEMGQIVRIERQLGKKLPRCRVNDFDYEHVAEPLLYKTRTGHVMEIETEKTKKPHRVQRRR